MPKITLPPNLRKQRWYETANGNQLFVEPGESFDERIEQWFAFLRERHMVYLRRQIGKAAPWTRDWVLNSYRFTNVYREIDRVSEWVTRNIIIPFENTPWLPVALVTARQINRMETLEKLMDTPYAFPVNKNWSAEAMYQVFKEIKESGQPVCGSAYVITPGSPLHPLFKHKDKAMMIAHAFIQGAFNSRAELQKAARGPKATMAGMVAALREVDGIGPFIAYQVAVDLSYSDKWLKNALDINTFNAAGPGTRRGSTYGIQGGYDFIEVGMKTKRTEITAFLQKLVEYGSGKYPELWPVNTDDPRYGFAPLSMSNCSNSACEMSKYAKVCLTGKRMKNSFSPESSNQTPLF